MSLQNLVPTQWTVTTGTYNLNVYIDGQETAVNLWFAVGAMNLVTGIFD